MIKFWYSLEMLSHSYKKYIGSSTRPELLAFYVDSQKLNHLKIELAAVVDWGEVSVKATCNLEGDDPLALTCYKTNQEVKIAIFQMCR